MCKRLLLEAVLSPGLPFWNNQHMLYFLFIIYSFACQFSLHYYWYCFNQKQSSGGVLQKKCSHKISQNSQENTCAKDSCLMNLQIYSLTLSKKRFRHRCFLVNSAKFLTKNPSDVCFCVNTRSVYCATMTFCLFKSNVTHIFRLSIFSA